MKQVTVKMSKNGGILIKRITKSEARKRYNNHEYIYAYACNEKPESRYATPCLLFKVWKRNFDRHIASVKKVCCHGKKGRYLAYYIKEI